MNIIRSFHIIILLFVAIDLLSCGNKNLNDNVKTLNQDQVTEKLLEANKAALEVENKQIERLIDSSGWNMVNTATGLRYVILQKGSGIKAEAGLLARFSYEVKLITGETVYSSEQSGPKEFRIGRGGVESGLEEGILLLRAGDKARFVIPSYLAHGLSGDQDKIPPKATLIYNIELIDLK